MKDLQHFNAQRRPRLCLVWRSDEVIHVHGVGCAEALSLARRSASGAKVQAILSLGDWRGNDVAHSGTVLTGVDPLDPVTLKISSPRLDEVVKRHGGPKRVMLHKGRDDLSETPASGLRSCLCDRVAVP